MLNWDYLKLEFSKLQDKKGRINKEKIKKNLPFISELENIEELKDFITLAEKRFAILNKITQLPKCPCGGSVKFDRDRNRYNLFCNNKCDHYKYNHDVKLRTINMIRYGVEYSSQIPSSILKMKKTNLERYGVENPFQSKEIKEKIKQINLERYGVENPSQSEEIKEKIKQTNLERFGVENPFESEEIKEKIKQTNLERYGVEYSLQNKEVREKGKQTNLEKYGAINYIASKEYQEKLKNKYISNILPIRLQQLKKQNIFPYEWGDDDFVNVKTKYQFIHSDCGWLFESKLISNLLPKCPKCHVLHGTSKIERHLQETLIQILGNKRVECNNRELIKPKELDIVIDNKLAIEVNGKFHHSEENEKNGKTTLLEKSNLSPIQVLHFWDFELEDKFDICLSIIKSKLNELDEVIYARKCIIKNVNSKDSIEFLEKNHLQGSSNSSVNLGLYYNDELVQILTLGKPRFNKKYDWEIHRIASRLNTKVIGGVSKLFKYFKDNTDSIKVITYADKRYSNGDIYKRLNFEEQKDSQPNYFWVNSELDVLTRYKTQKHKLEKLLGKENFNSELTESENMQLNGFWKIKDCGNKVFKLN